MVLHYILFKFVEDNKPEKWACTQMSRSMNRFLSKLEFKVIIRLNTLKTIFNNFDLHSGSPWDKIAKTFAMVDYEMDMTAKKYTNGHGKYGSFEQLLFLFKVNIKLLFELSAML